MKLKTYSVGKMYEAVFDPSQTSKRQIMLSEFRNSILPESHLTSFDWSKGFYQIVKLYCKLNNISEDKCLVLYDPLGSVIIIPNITFEEFVSSFKKFLKLKVFL